MISRRMGKSIESATTNHSYQRLTADNSALVLINHQLENLLTSNDIDQEELRHNVVASARSIIYNREKNK
jgi:hypothetical protein